MTQISIKTFFDNICNQYIQYKGTVCGNLNSFLDKHCLTHILHFMTLNLEEGSLIATSNFLISLI